MKYQLKHKLILSYVLLSLTIVSLISYFTNFITQKEFQNYVINNQENITNNLLMELSDLYAINNLFDTTTLEPIGIRAIEQGLIISIMDIDGSIIWSAMEHNSGLCETMISNVRENMFSYNASWNGDYVEKDFQINSNDKIVGTLVTGYLGPFYFKDDELLFLNTLNKILIFIAIGSFLIALIIGVIMAKSITSPITKVISRLNRIQTDNATNNLILNTNIIEIQKLYDSTLSLEKRISHQEILRKQLSQDIAHELRTPLTAVQGHMEAMIDGIWDISVERLTSSYDEIIRIKNLIQRIEDLARVENENLVLHTEFFSLSSLLDDIIKTFCNELDKNNMTIDYESNNLMVKADKEKLRQVFYNLLSNSIEYAGVNSSIFISSTSDAKNTIINFSDNGVGIFAKDSSYIFERFYRADPSRSKNKGLGIGLTISRAIMQAHQGSITINPKVNQGTQFIIKLPKP